MQDPQSANLVNALARIWPSLPELVGPDWPDLELQILFRLRALDAASEEGKGEARDSVLQALERFPKAYRKLIAEMPRKLRSREVTATASDPTKRKPAPERYLQVPVFYATDRKPTGKHTPEDRFSGKRGSLSYGIARVSIPDDHRMGEIEKPRWWRLEFRPNPERHVVLLGVDPLERDSFIGQAKSITVQYGVPEALIFVHGFRVSFADAARRTAQIAYDLGFKGVPCMYSWPSVGDVDDYFTDGENAQWSIPRFREFLGLTLEDLGLSTVHVIAHSMGNRVVANALSAFDVSTMKPGAARLRHLVLAAPDIDAGVFRDLAKSFHARAERCTLYASSEDKALKASGRFVGYPRAGESGAGLVVVDGIDTIDASRLDTGFLSHSYIGDNDSILSDVHDLILNGEPPGDRFRLKELVREGKIYWAFKP